jgi:hypothetical protein
VLGADEVVTFLESVSSLKARVALTTAYAAGLRVSEVAALKVRDIDSSRMVKRIEHGKGGKERCAMLSAPLLGILRSYWRLARPPLYLFPGRNPDKPIEPTVLHAALPPGGGRGGARQADQRASAAAAPASCALPAMSSSVVSSCTSCPTASIASVTTGSSPKATAPAISQRSGLCLNARPNSSPPTRRPRQRSEGPSLNPIRPSPPVPECGGLMRLVAVEPAASAFSCDTS